MTDEPTLDATPEPEAAPERARVEAPPRKRGWDALPVLYLIGFLVLAGALAYLYVNPVGPQPPEEQAQQVNTLQQQVEGLRGRLGDLETRQAPPSTPSPDLAALQQQVADLTKRVAALSGGPVAGPELQTRLDALEKQITAMASRPDGAAPAALAALADQVRQLQNRPAAPTVDLGPLTARVERLESRPPVDLGPLTARLDAFDARARTVVQEINGRLDALEKGGRDLVAQTQALEKQVQAVDAVGKQNAAALNGVAQKAQRAARLQAAADALQAGQKLGAIPDAPPALARFAEQAPPTEAQLRLSFDQYAQAAQRASQPATMDHQDFGTRLWARAQQVVTVRQGDRVLLGDPISGVLAHAREALDAGDLKGAVAALNELAGPAASAMKPWVEQATSLLDARAAISSMAAG